MTTVQDCAACEGKGSVVRQTPALKYPYDEPCMACQGTGRVEVPIMPAVITSQERIPEEALRGGEHRAFPDVPAIAQCGGCGHAVNTRHELRCPACGCESIVFFVPTSKGESK